MKIHNFYNYWLNSSYDSTYFKTINRHIDFNDISIDLLCDLISDNQSKWNIDDYAVYDEYDCFKQSRFLKKFKKTAKDIEIKQLISSFSSFCCIYLNRVEKECVSNDIRYEEMYINPVKIKYFDSIDDIFSILSEPTKKNNVNFEIRTLKKGSEEPPLCDICNGIGTLLCKKCEGSGREEFTSGYFASGEPKIKVGNCSNCQGAGKIKCTKCKGTGKMIIPSDNYQQIRFIEDKYKIVIINVGNTCRDSKIEISDAYNYKLDKINAYNAPKENINYLKKYSIKFWAEKSKEEIENSLISLQKNENEKIIDKDIFCIDFENELYKNAFNENYNEYKNHLKELDNNGHLVSEMFNNTLVPTITLTYHVANDDREYEIYFIKSFDDDGSPITLIRASDLPYMSIWKLLF